MKINSNSKLNLASSIKEKLGSNDGLKERINTLQVIIAKKIKAFNGLIFRNKGRGLIGLMLKLVRGVRPRASKSVVKQVAGFSFRCYRIAHYSGLKGLVLYLKACQVLLQQCVGGYRVVDLSELKVRPKRNRSGVPLIIPAGVRVLISQKKDIPSIKLWMTLLGTYRVLEFKGVLSLNTITDPGLDLKDFLPVWRKFIETEFKVNLFNLVKVPKYSASRIFPILKSGPITKMDPSNKFEESFTNSSVKALIMTARTFLKKGNEHLLKALTTIASQSEGGNTFLSRLKMMTLASHKELDLWLFTELGIRPLGRLGFKPEPAGKVRVFAMVDSWTHWILEPLHKWLFQILEQIPQDGTFNQMNPISTLQSKFGHRLKGQISSIDLSAATDRLPIELQVIILEVLLKDIVPDSAAFARSWADLLIKRDYLVVTDPKEREFKLPSDIKLSNNLKENKLVSYSVGQPMGALSSWAMLAITHHAMMQFSAHSANHKSLWFKDYAVLGDDGVIKGKNPSSRYISLLKTIGVKAGLAKSILASNRFVIEFAKKFFVGSERADMLPVKECIATWCSTSLVNEFVRKYDLSLNAILSFLGYGYKSKSKVYKTLYFDLPTRLRVLLIWLSHPNGTLGTDNYFDWVTQKSWSRCFMPSQDALRNTIKILEDKNCLKLNRILAAFDLYSNSLKTVDQRLDKVYPISIFTLNERTENTFQVPVPWKAVLSPDLQPEDLDHEHLSRMYVGGTDTFGGVNNANHWTLSHKRLRELNVGIDIDKLITDFKSKVSNPDTELFDKVDTLFKGPMWREWKLSILASQDTETSIQDKIETQCRYYFELDELQGSIPDEFWNEERTGEKPFRDFLSIYKFWQDVSKPLWSEFNGKDFSIESIEESPKLESDSRTVRGEQERLVKHFTPLEPSTKGSQWVSFTVGFLISILILELIGHKSGGSDIVPILYDISSKSETLPDPLLFSTNSLKDSECITVVYPWWMWFCFMTGALMLCVTGITSYMNGQFTDPYWVLFPVSPEIPTSPIIQPALQLDTVMVGTMRISGPISSHSLRILQVQLENGALLDNLAISPIGALWELPIV